ncbi:S1C family serine protease [Ornithinibacillus sp. 4-3]|uniref:S1C family serine protease n=1 Tax=Ornithinibacillus sp. 4-3 TaxID=3231488 RepID=A0AB39HSV8_9BACI
MDKKEHENQDIIDKDLYEDIDDEEMYELVQEARREILEKEREEKENPPPRKSFPKWTFWIIAIALVINIIALLPQTISIPAIDFIKTSIRLSAQEDIKEYKKSVVVIEAGDSRGTGFSISEDGTILTNYHVIEGENPVTIAFPEEGLYSGEVTEVYPDIDLAVVEVKGEGLPHLTLADQTDFQQGDKINFIGNPLNFNGIANEGEIINYTRLGSWDEDVIMIQAPVYRGNSGSPIINQDGLVIGIIFATMETDSHGKVGLFIPIDLYYKYIDE